MSSHFQGDYLGMGKVYCLNYYVRFCVSSFLTTWCNLNLIQLSYHLYFFMDLVKITEAKATMMKGKVVDAEIKFSEAKTRTAEVERVSRTKEMCGWFFNISSIRRQR